MTIEEETQEQKIKSLWLEYIWLKFFSRSEEEDV